jgi:Uma2 family endonuclease
MANDVLNLEPQESALTQGLEVTSVWKFSVEQYQQMIASGTIAEDAPVELLEGWIVTKMSKNPPRIYSTEESAELIREVLPRGYFIQRQDPITTSDSQPEPDVSVIKGNRQDFKTRLPNLDEIVLVIEVSDSTLKRDHIIKQRIYASAGIPIYWILNLQDRTLEVYTNPLPNEKRYEEQTSYDTNSSVPLVIDAVEVAHLAIKDLLP